MLEFPQEKKKRVIDLLLEEEPVQLPQEPILTDEALNQQLQQITQPQPEKKTVLGVFMNVLSRPNWAVASGAEAMKEGKPVGKAMLQGIKGEKETSFVDVFNKHPIHPDLPEQVRKYEASIAGFGMDILTDPLTYISPGMISKTLGKADDVTKASKLGKKIAYSKRGKTMGELFRPGHLLKRTEEGAQFYDDWRFFISKLQSSKTDVVKESLGRAKDLSKAERELLYRSFFEDVELPEKLKKLKPFYEQQTSKWLTEEAKRGLLKPEYAKEGYAPKRYTEHAWKSIYGTGRPITEKYKPIYARRMFYKTLEEAEKAGKNPITDIEKVFTLRELEHVDSVMKHDFIMDTLSKYGEKVSSAAIPSEKELAEKGLALYFPKGKTRLYPAKTITEKELTSIQEAAFEGMDNLVQIKDLKSVPAVSKRVPVYALPSDIADHLNKYGKILSDQKAINRVARGYDKALGIWKGYATAANPGFHFRNEFSNFWQGFLKDGYQFFNPERHKTAVAIMAGRDGTLKLANGKIMSYKEIGQLANELGVRGKGWMSADVVDDMLKTIDYQTSGKVVKGLKTVNPLSNEFAITKYGKKFGTVVEDQARMTGFINDLIKTGDPQASAKNVKKFFFDYSELTLFEQKYMKRIFPFYTWTRKNIPLQLEQALLQPRKFAGIHKFKTAFENLSEPPDVALPDYFDKLYAIRTPWRSKPSSKHPEGMPLYLNPNLAFQDLNRMIDIQSWLGMLTPAKLAFELKANYSLWSNAPIEKKPGQLVKAPFWVAWLPQESKSKLGIMPGRDKETGDTVLMMPPKLRYAMMNSFPFLANLSRVYPGAALVSEEAVPYHAASWLGGVKLMPLDKDMRRQQVIWDTIKEIEKFKNKHKSLNRGY